MGVSGFCAPGWFGRRRRVLPLWMLGAVAPPVHYDAIDRRRPAAVGRSRQLREKAIRSSAVDGPVAGGWLLVRQP
jgi:hypothetical protein